jgi:LysM domain
MFPSPLFRPPLFRPPPLPHPKPVRYDARDEMRFPQPRFLFLIPLATALLAVLVAACGGGGGDSEREIGSITNPGDVPTTSPWGQPPDVLLLDPNAIPTLPAGGSAATPTPAPGPDEGGEPGVCGPKYTVASGDTFSSIATKCGATTQGMRDANPGVDPLTIRPGQVVNVPAATPAPSP